MAHNLSGMPNYEGTSPVQQAVQYISPFQPIQKIPRQFIELSHFEKFVFSKGKPIDSSPLRQDSENPLRYNSSWMVLDFDPLALYSLSHFVFGISEPFTNPTLSLQCWSSFFYKQSACPNIPCHSTDMGDSENPWLQTIVHLKPGGTVNIKMDCDSFIDFVEFCSAENVLGVRFY